MRPHRHRPNGAARGLFWCLDEVAVDAAAVGEEALAGLPSRNEAGDLYRRQDLYSRPWGRYRYWGCLCQARQNRIRLPAATGHLPAESDRLPLGPLTEHGRLQYDRSERSRLLPL